jgi:hypothetical protein
MSRRLRFALGALSLLVGFAGSCGGERFTSGGGGEGGGASGAAGVPGAAGVATGRGGQGGSAKGESGSGGEAGSVPSGPVTTVISIQGDADDAVFITDDDGVEERLSYDPNTPHIEVGTDDELGRIGLRFPLAIPPGSLIDAASLSLTRVDGDADATATMRVEVYESANVPVFSEQHRHRPQAHVVGGLWSTFVGGFGVGADDERVTSPDLSELVQHVVHRIDFRAGSTIGFVLSPEDMSGWVSFADSSALTMEQAALTIEYRAP